MNISLEIHCLLDYECCIRPTLYKTLRKRMTQAAIKKTAGEKIPAAINLYCRTMIRVICNSCGVCDMPYRRLPGCRASIAKNLPVQGHREGRLAGAAVANCVEYVLTQIHRISAELHKCRNADVHDIHVVVTHKITVTVTDLVSSSPIHFIRVDRLQVAES